MAVRGRHLSLPALPLPDELEQDDGESEYVAHGGNCEKRFVHRRHLLGGTAHGQPPTISPFPFAQMRQNLPVPTKYDAVVRIHVIIRQTYVCFKTLNNTNVSYHLADASDLAQRRHILQKFGLSIARVSSAGDFWLYDHELGETDDSINTFCPITHNSQLHVRWS